ncbi:MAG: hypothetical protein ACLRTR_06865 [Clostridia bacterium]|jgi:hypothetical protein
MTDLVNLAIRKNFFGEEREFKLYVNQPHVLDVFIPAEDKLNILLLIEITSDECNHSRAGMRIRRKLSPLFAKKYDKVQSNYSIIHQEDGKNFMRAEFHCYSRISGRKLYGELKKEFFK